MYLFVSFQIFLSCKGQKKEILNCDGFNKKFVEYVMERKRDSALIYIDKAIDCNPESSFYRFSKVNYLIDNKDWIGASNGLKKIKQQDDITIKMMIAVLDLKMKNPNAEESLNDVWILSNKDAKDINYSIYDVALTNFFKGKEEALLKLSDLRNEYDDVGSVKKIDFLKENINKESNELVLYNLFNIRE